MDNLQFDLNDFIKDEKSICREERQYALYLYNMLDNQGSIVIKNKGEESGTEYKIEKVFFEVSFLRDYFEDLKKKEKKRKFNEALVNFARAKDRVNHPEELKDTGWDGLRDEEKDFLQGHVNGWHYKSDVWKKVGTKLPQYLMNAQPDIGMVLSAKDKNNKYYICFIECKYCSDFGKYPTKGTPLPADTGRYHQLTVQNYIAKFLCDDEIGLNAYYAGSKLTPLLPRCTMVAWFKKETDPEKSHLYQYPDEKESVEFTPILLLDDLINNNKTIEINDGQLEFKEE